MAPVTGFIYAPHERKDPMSGARVGARIGIDGRGPPWIVVYPRLAMPILEWPGRLWRVEVVDRVTDADRRAAGWGKARSGPHGRYIRAVSLIVLEELPVSRLFGPEGAEAICSVLDYAARLQPNDVPRLAQARHPDAERLYRRWYDDWMRWHARGWRGFFRRLRHGRDHGNNGTGTLRQVMYKRAKRVAGESAFVYDEEADANVLNPAWGAAHDALRDAAIAFGSPSLYQAEERGELMAAWRAVGGPDSLNPRAIMPTPTER